MVKRAPAHRQLKSKGRRAGQDHAKGADDMKIGSASRSLPLPFLFACGCLAVRLATPLSSMQGSVFPDCLNGSSSRNPFKPTEHTECSKDLLSLGDDKTIRDSERLL